MECKFYEILRLLQNSRSKVLQARFIHLHTSEVSLYSINFVMSCAVLYFCICQCSRRGPNRDPGFTSVRGMADVAPTDNYGAWLKFAPSCMSDAQWGVAAETPEAVLSHRSCPWGGHLIKIDSKMLGTAWFCIVLHRDTKTVSRYASMLQDLLCSQLILLCFEHV